MHTEEEAKQKWCPHVIASHADPRAKIAPIDRPEGVTDKTADFYHNCIASKCMAWRWSNYNPTEPREGYCGLSGKPRFK